MESVRRPRDPNGRPKSFAFIVYIHECSVPYALEIFRGTKLFNRIININSRSTLRHIPVLDTHITEYTEPRERVGYEEEQEIESRRYQERERNRSDRNEVSYVQESESRMYHDMEDNRREQSRSDNHRPGSNNKNRQHSRRERDVKEPTSWAELNALCGKNFAHSNLRPDLQGSSGQQRELSNGSQMIPDFNTLLQMGQQMLLPSGCMEMGGFPFPNMMPAVGGLGPGFRGDNMYPSVPGMMGGSDRYSPERDGRRRDNHNRREHPYRDQERHDHRDDHRRHDRRYTSSRSSHDRERRERRSR